MVCDYLLAGVIITPFIKLLCYTPFARDFAYKGSAFFCTFWRANIRNKKAVGITGLCQQTVRDTFKAYLNHQNDLHRPSQSVFCSLTTALRRCYCGSSIELGGVPQVGRAGTLGDACGVYPTQAQTRHRRVCPPDGGTALTPLGSLFAYFLPNSR